ncbi:hypothetical protein L202_02632 [Cryptococcus amylolentus CBS 6039]|uniref:FAS1 domain-containing protein n=1 Tax=Cryptococcus amylolentus CBS 6039 TaxID=1295533 RepID=A0A1E3HVP0_9TREE|nr:hypothetical protein L202_02632 [Cryptococcus amylolentus CBS 6039]ODN80380.1 hypothetical protein L202_02632 [Cryptococcus amylolentus CBS 6039]
MLQPEYPNSLRTLQNDNNQLAFNGDPEASRRETGTGKGTAGGDLVDAVLGPGTASGQVGKQQEGQEQTSAGRKGPTVADVLTTERALSLWWGYARDSVEITQRFESKTQSSTLLVPVDRAIMALTRKPCPSEGSSSEDAVLKFISAHIIDGTPEEGPLPTLLPDFSVYLVKDASAKGGWRVKPGNIEVLGERSGVNGRVLYLAEVLPYVKDQDVVV